MFTFILFAVGLSTTAHAACPAPFDGAACGVLTAGADVCTFVGATVTCDLQGDAVSRTAGSHAWVVNNDGSGSYGTVEAWGSLDGTTDFCCSIGLSPPGFGGYTRTVELIGTDGSDHLAFTWLDGQRNLGGEWTSFPDSCRPGIVGIMEGGAGSDVMLGTYDGLPHEPPCTAEELYGGDGNDVIIVHRPGNVDAGAGDDFVWGSDYADEIVLGNGNDIAHGFWGQDTIDGNEGVDVISGDQEIDTLDGGGGADALQGGRGADILHGGTGDDWILADDYASGAGADTVFGGDGADTVFGGGGDDVIDGGNGADRLGGGAGSDLVIGGWGPDGVCDQDGDPSTVDRLDGRDTLAVFNHDDLYSTDSTAEFLYDGGDDCGSTPGSASYPCSPVTLAAPAVRCPDFH